MGETVLLTVEKSLSITQLYERVKNYDLVLTVDAPFADALNARLDIPRLGHFATTPKRLALDNLRTDQEILQDQREIFLRIAAETDLNWKQSTYLLENILNCWQETGEIDRILAYERFNNAQTRQIITILKNTINPYSAREQYTVPSALNLAVVAPHQFTALDKKVLPSEYDEILPFTSEETSLPVFNIFNSTTEIIETILYQLDHLDPKDVAVVMDPASQYRYLLESVFTANDIPYMSPEDITEEETVRVFLNLIRASFFERSLRVRDVKAFLQEDALVDPVTEEYFIHSFQDSTIEQIKNLLNTIPSLTFKELLQTDVFGEQLKALQPHLERLGFLDKKITIGRLHSLTYYLDTFDITIESARRGVLLPSPGSSTYIDRPVIFYLGMDTAWTPEPPTAPWIDKVTFDEQKIKDFQILLQNGEQQYFLVQDRQMNNDVTPSFYFNEFTDQKIESFRDFNHELKKRALKPDNEQPFTKEAIAVETDPITTMSQSTLNTFAYCPKDYFFSHLVDTPDKIYFKKGTLLHDFAEFYLNHSETIENHDQIVGKMVKELTPFLHKQQILAIQTQLSIAIQNLIAFLEDQEPQLHDPPGYQKKRTDNIFAQFFDMPVATAYTEASFHNEDIGAKGKVDLILSHDHLVDHKSGSKKSLSKIMTLSDIEHIDRKPNFQAKMYIAHHRSHYPDTPINFTFYHMLDNIKDVVSGESDHTDNMVTVEYHPEEFNDLASKNLMFQWLQSSNRRRKLLTKLGYPEYRQFFEHRSIPDLEKNELLEHPITDEFVAFCQQKIGSYKYVENGCKGILKQLVKFRNEHYFKGDIDAFESFLQEQIQKYNEYKTSTFPVGDIDPDELDNKDLVIA